MAMAAGGALAGCLGQPMALSSAMALAPAMAHAVRSTGMLIQELGATVSACTPAPQLPHAASPSGRPAQDTTTHIPATRELLRARPAAPGRLPTAHLWQGCCGSGDASTSSRSGPHASASSTSAQGRSPWRHGSPSRLPGWSPAGLNLGPGAWSQGPHGPGEWPLGTQQRRGYQKLSPELMKDIQASALKKQTGVSLKHLLDFGTQPLDRQMLLSARFLHAEIPIRLAHRLMDLNALPRALSDEPHVRRVKGWYAESFADFRAVPAIKDREDAIRFTAMLRNAFRRHNNVVPAIAKGVEVYKRQLAEAGESTTERDSEIQHFLDTFFLSRIAIRFLAGHHLSMFEPPRPDHIGLVHTKCSPYQIATDAAAEARAICFREYGNAPPVNMLGNADLTMAYVPSHLHHMVFELVKNSLRAVQERYGDADEEPPPISVVVAEGLEDVTIKVSDQGGGISRSGLKRIWTYLYTTARSPLPEVDIDSSHMPAVLAGYGCGLPLSRMYARYFGGDLQIISMEGYGTDAYLHLARLGNDEEPLPGSV